MPINNVVQKKRDQATVTFPGEKRNEKQTAPSNQDKLWNWFWNWETHKLSLNEYNKEIRRSKRNFWIEFCESINKIPSAAKGHKVPAKTHISRIGPVLKPGGSMHDKKYKRNPGLKKMLPTNTHARFFHEWHKQQPNEFTRERNHT